MTEPDCTRYTGEPEDLENQIGWLVEAEADARSEGCTFVRGSLSECGRQLVMEGWKQQPDRLPEPQFAFTAVPAEVG